MTLHLRRGAPADLPRLVELEALFPSDRMSVRSLRRFLALPGERFWVAEEHGRVVGNLLWTRRGSVARIYSLVVAPAARGRGIARRLVEAAEAAAYRDGARRVALEVRADNAAARALYAGLGYTVARALPGYYDDGADGLRLEKRLQQPLDESGRGVHSPG